MSTTQLARLKRRSLTRRYLRSRGHHTAAQALHYAKQRPVKPLDWDYSLERAEWNQDGFRLVARVKYDDSPDISFMGEISTTWKAGAIVVDPNDDLARNARGRYSDRPVYFHTESGKGTREYLVARGAASGPAEDLARSYARQEFRRYRSFMRNDWDYVGIIVDAYRAGIKLGSDSIWGIERYGRNTPGFDASSDCRDYFTETARDCASRAIDEARANIGKLRRVR
jgi:hypothetical protein